MPYPTGFVPVSLIQNFDPTQYLEPLHVFRSDSMQIGDAMKREVCLFKNTLVYWVSTDPSIPNCGKRRPYRKNKTREKLSSKHRSSVFNLGLASGWTCVYCRGAGTNTVGPDRRAWHLDHIYPRARGGDDEKDNLALSCATCNLRKSALLISDFKGDGRG